MQEIIKVLATAVLGGVISGGGMLINFKVDVAVMQNQMKNQGQDIVEIKEQLKKGRN